MVSFPGALVWPYLYPWPPRAPGLIETGFDELARRWKPILDAYDAAGVNVGFELHPGEDVMDGVTFEMFLERLGNHPRCRINYDPSHFVLQQLDYVEFIDFYHERICAFHVKDAEFNPTGKQGVYSGFQSWVKRAGRFRSLGDGQVDFGAVFSKLAEYDYDSWAVLEWECAIKSPAQGAAEGAPFIAGHLIQVSEHAFDDFAKAANDEAANRRMLGIG
jgi:sugar phosphate isomerase/epimerase